MKSSRKKLEYLSSLLHAEGQFYNFNREAKAVPKYRKGALSSIDYLQELIKFHLDCETKIQEEFIKDIEKQEQIIEQLNESEYKQAILDIINYAKHEIRDKSPERVSVLQAKKKYS